VPPVGGSGSPTDESKVGLFTAWGRCVCVCMCVCDWRGGVFVHCSIEDIHVSSTVTVRISARHISPSLCKPGAPSERGNSN